MCSTRSDAAQIDQCLRSARAIRKRTEQSALYITRLCLLHTDWSVWRSVTSASAVSLNEDIHEQQLLRESLHEYLPFDLSYHIHTELWRYSRQTVKIKVPVKLGKHCVRNILILFSRMYILLILGYYYNYYNYFFKVIISQHFHVLNLIVNPLLFAKINKVWFSII